MSLTITNAFDVQEVPEVVESQDPDPPDYTSIKYWAAHPLSTDSADLVPSDTFMEMQDSADVDVFFIHPTTYTGWKKEGMLNADLSWDKVNKDTDARPIRHQASVFNGSARVFAPRYRQAHLSVFLRRTDSATRNAALDLAYRDIRAAFQYYLDHYNLGRPIIIASHSQGTRHAEQLVREFFDDKPLMENLVCAYLIGMPVNIEAFETIPPCTEDTDYGCFCSWRSVADKFTPGKRFNVTSENPFNINPLTWTTNGNISPVSAHLGLVNKDYYGPLASEAVRARVGSEFLRVEITGKHVKGLLLKVIRNFHIADYNLFWANLRKNVEDRCQAFLNRK